MADSNGWIFWYNRRWFEYTGTTLEQMQGWEWRRVHHPDHVEGVVARIRRSFETGEPWEDTFPLRAADGSYRWFLSRALPIRDADGRIVRWFGTHTDVSEQKQTEERQRLLVNELNHRVKNTLAVIQSIASVTSRSATSAAAFSKSFIARIIGIARTHDLLTESHWEGASLRAILWNELSPYQSEGSQRIVLVGADVRLAPKTAVALGMVMHEMTTNAAKYGALATPDGGIEVRWETQREPAGPLLRLVWTERGGPPAAPPSHQGFGSRLIAQSLTRDLAGRVHMDYRPEGLRCVFEIPLAAAAPAVHAA
jgi:PAS domain S-box-containing protein